MREVREADGRGNDEDCTTRLVVSRAAAMSHDNSPISHPARMPPARIVDASCSTSVVAIRRSSFLPYRFVVDRLLVVPRRDDDRGHLFGVVGGDADEGVVELPAGHVADVVVPSEQRFDLELGVVHHR